MSALCEITAAEQRQNTKANSSSFGKGQRDNMAFYHEIT